MANTQDGPARTAEDFAERNAPHAAESASGLFGEAAEAFKEGARTAAEEQKAAGAERIGGLAQALRGAGDELSKEIPGAAEYVHSAADKLERASSALREKDIGEFVNSASRVMRRQPAAAFAGSIVVGFALARFLKSSR